MYTLRIINQNGSETNEFLGNSYTWFPKEGSYESFKNAYYSIFNEDYEKVVHSEDEEVYGIVQSESSYFPLYNKMHGVYIVTNEGKTFDNLAK